MCDNFKRYSLNVVHACSVVGMDAGLYFTLVSLLFSAISISISNTIFTLVLKRLLQYKKLLQCNREGELIKFSREGWLVICQVCICK